MKGIGNKSAIAGTARILLLGLLSSLGVSCQSVDTRHHVVVSAAEQKMVLLEQGQVVRTYPISTSKFGLGDKKNSYRTPTGKMMIARKIGDNTPKGAVFKSRQWTGEVLSPDAPGRDPVLTRILWLKGREFSNRNTYNRLIYIHGTTEERNIGRPVSFGCIRMKSDDVFDLYQRVRVGTPVTVMRGKMPMAVQTAEMRQNMKKAWSATGHALAMKRPEPVPEKVVPEAEPMPVGPKPAGPPQPSTSESVPTGSSPVGSKAA